MKRAFLMLTLTNHCNQLQNEMVDPPSLDALHEVWMSFCCLPLYRGLCRHNWVKLDSLYYT